MPAGESRYPEAICSESPTRLLRDGGYFKGQHAGEIAALVKVCEVVIYSPSHRERVILFLPLPPGEGWAEGEHQRCTHLAFALTLPSPDGRGKKTLVTSLTSAPPSPSCSNPRTSFPRCSTPAPHPSRPKPPATAPLPP